MRLNVFVRAAACVCACEHVCVCWFTQSPHSRMLLQHSRSCVNKLLTVYGICILSVHISLYTNSQCTYALYIFTTLQSTRERAQRSRTLTQISHVRDSDSDNDDEARFKIASVRTTGIGWALLFSNLHISALHFPAFRWTSRCCINIHVKCTGLLTSNKSKHLLNFEHLLLVNWYYTQIVPPYGTPL